MTPEQIEALPADLRALVLEAQAEALELVNRAEAFVKRAEAATAEIETLTGAIEAGATLEELEGLTWFNGLEPGRRRHWLTLAGELATPADAYAYWLEVSA